MRLPCGAIIGWGGAQDFIYRMFRSKARYTAAMPKPAGPRPEPNQAQPTLAQLRLFVAVADEGSFSGAAESLGLSQSTLSEGVRALEKSLGQSLLLRGRAGVSLTPAGQAALGHARDALIAVQDLKLAADPAQAYAGKLVVATYRSLGQQILAPALALLRESHPELHVTILDASSDGHGGAELVRRAQADLALIEKPSEGGVRFEALLHDPYRVVMPATSAGPLTWEALRSKPLLLPILSTNQNYERLVAFLRAYHALSEQITEVAEDDVILSMVRYGMGYTIFPELGLGNLPSSLVSVPLPVPFERVVGLAVRPGRSGLPHIGALMGAIRAVARVDG